MTLTNEQEDNVALALAVADEDIPPEVSTDKGGRKRWNQQRVLLETYAKTGKLANEGVEDSFLDIAVYSIIALLLWREEESDHGLAQKARGSS